MAIKDDFKDGRLPINQTPGNLISHTWLNSVAAAVNVTIPDLQTQIDDLAEAGGASAAPHPSFPWALILTTTGGEDPGNFPPTVNIDSATAVDLTATVAWTASDPEGTPLTYSVAWGDGATTNLATSPATHTYDAGDAGTVTITVTASDGDKSGSDTAQVLIGGSSLSIRVGPVYPTLLVVRDAPFS